MMLGHAWLRRTVLSPLFRMLRRGASPRRLGYSLAAGFIIGTNPVLGSNTLVTIAVTHLFRLNHSASQIGTHAAYPVQLLLFLPFLQAGIAVFHGSPIPFQPAQLLGQVRHHPWLMLRQLWTWEWHALVVWAVAALILFPALAFVVTRLLQRALPHHGNN